MPTTTPEPVTPVTPAERATPKSLMKASCALGHQHVRGLEVAMDHLAPVRGREPSARVGARSQRVFGRHRAAVVEQLLERPPVDVVHADEPASVVLHEVVDAHDVRARHLAREQDLLAEARERIGPGGELGPQQLERDRHAELLVARAVDHAHAADAEQLLDAEAPRDELARRAARRWRTCPVTVAASAVHVAARCGHGRRSRGGQSRCAASASAAAHRAVRRLHGAAPVALAVRVDREPDCMRASASSSAAAASTSGLRRERAEQFGIELGEDLAGIVAVGVGRAEQAALVLERHGDDRAQPPRHADARPFSHA